MADPTDREQLDREQLARIISEWETFRAGDGELSIGMKDKRSDQQIVDEILDWLAGRDKAVLAERDTYGEEYHRCYCEGGVDHVSDL